MRGEIEKPVSSSSKRRYPSRLLVRRRWYDLFSSDSCAALSTASRSRRSTAALIFLGSSFSRPTTSLRVSFSATMISSSLAWMAAVSDSPEPVRYS